MDISRLLDDTAKATTAAVLEVFNLRDDERAEAFCEIYARVRAGLEAFVEFRKREHRRFFGSPGHN